MSTTGTLKMKLLPTWAVRALHGAPYAYRLSDGSGWNTALEATVRPHVVSKRTTCRACGEQMPKGTPVLRFAFDLDGRGSPDPIRGLWTECSVHAQPCSEAMRREATRR